MGASKKGGSRMFVGAVLIAVLTSMSLLSGCSTTPAKQVKGVLRIAYPDEQSFYYTYGDYFAVRFPDVNVEIIPTQELRKPGIQYYEEYGKLLDEQKPDLIFTYLQEYERFSASGRLLDLAPIIKRNKFDLEQFSPAAIEFLKNKGGGKLHGLTPQFTSTALFFNKDLFDRYQIPYPTDHMSWEDTMLLARRFPVDPNVDKRVYGIHEKYRTPFDFIYDIAATNGLSYVSGDGTRMTLDTPEWLNTFRVVIEGFKSGNLYYYESGGKPINYGPNETKQMDLFSAGKAAMMISSPEQMMRMQQNNVKLNWDLVTVPVDPKNPNLTRHLSVGTIFAIPSRAEHADTAWKVIEYFNGDEAAKVTMKTAPDNLSTRKSFMNDKEGRSLEAFYKLSRDERSSSFYPDVPLNFYTFYETLVVEEIDAAVKGKQSVEDTVKSIQKRAQEQLTKLLNEQPPTAKTP